MAKRLENEKTKLFLCCSYRAEAIQLSFVGLIKELLQKGRFGFDVEMGDDVFTEEGFWRKTFHEKIKSKSTLVVLFLSPDFLLSRNCMYEYKVAYHHLTMRGAPLISVFLKHPEKLPPDDEYKDRQDQFIIPDASVSFDLTDLFIRFDAGNEFIDKNPGYFNELADSVNKIGRQLDSLIEEFQNKPQIMRVIYPNEPALEESRSLYESYPKDYCDKLDSIKRWLGQSSDPHQLKDDYIYEMYYVAYLNQNIVGILYASYYPRTDTNKNSWAYIMPLVVDENYLSLPGDDNIAQRLIERLMEDTSQNGRPCDRILLELPCVVYPEDEEEQEDDGEDDREEDYDEIVERCYRGWQSLPDEMEIKIFRGFLIYSPDAVDFREQLLKKTPEKYESDPVQLMTLGKFPEKSPAKKKSIIEILDFIYDVYCGEAYFDPFILPQWMKKMEAIKNDVINTLPDKILVESTLPRELIKRLKELGQE